MRKLLVIVEKSANDMFSAYTPETKTTVLNGQGLTVEAALSDLRESLTEVRDSYRDSGNSIPKELDGEFDFEIKYDMASLFSHFEEINLSSFARKIGLNESLLRKYKSGLAYASEKQCRKIEQGLHQLGKSLCNASL